VHCAVLGGNLKLLKWLVDEHCCPIKSVRISGKTRDSAGKYTPIVTSKGRSLLGIALEHSNVAMIRYLVVTKGISLSGEKDITTSMLIQNLDAVLRLLPEQENGYASAIIGQMNEREDASGSQLFEHASAPLAPDLEDIVPVTPEQAGRSLSEQARAFGAVRSSSREKVDDLDHLDECKSLSCFVCDESFVFFGCANTNIVSFICGERYNLLRQCN